MIFENYSRIAGYNLKPQPDLKKKYLIPFFLPFAVAIGLIPGVHSHHHSVAGFTRLHGHPQSCHNYTDEVFLGRAFSNSRSGQVNELVSGPASPALHCARITLDRDLLPCKNAVIAFLYPHSLIVVDYVSARFVTCCATDANLLRGPPVV
jgi:hypothetical protein